MPVLKAAKISASVSTFKSLFRVHSQVLSLSTVSGIPAEIDNTFFLLLFLLLLIFIIIIIFIIIFLLHFFITFFYTCSYNLVTKTITRETMARIGN